MKEIPVYLGAAAIETIPVGKMIITREVSKELAYNSFNNHKILLGTTMHQTDSGPEILCFNILSVPASSAEFAWVVREHSDKTEGRGPMNDVGVFETELEAFTRCRDTSGVMGNPRHYGGEIWRVFLGSYPLHEDLVFGHRKDWNDKWGPGWIDLRDKPKDDDPDYIEFTRLRKKFDPTYEE